MIEMKFPKKNDRLKIFLVALVLILSFVRSSAQVMPDDSLIHHSIGEISHVVRQDAVSVNNWWWGWLAGYSAATIGQGIAGISSGKSSRQDMFLGAATTLIGAIGQIYSPVQPVKIRHLNSHLSDSLSDSTRLIIYREYLKKMSAAETRGKGWKMHLESGAVNLGSGLVTWLGFRRSFKDGLVNFALNTAVTEAQIWSQPIKAKRYCSKYFQQGIAENSSIQMKEKCSVFVGTSANGITLALCF